MIKKTAKRTFLLILALIALSAGIFVFTRPMLAPGFDAGKFADTKTLNQPIEDNTFSITPEFEDVGKNVKADSFLIFNEESGEVIVSKNPKAALAIASITKLMTAYVVQKYGNLDDIWAIGQSSTNNVRPVLGLSIGDRVKIKDLVNSILIGSANDAASALGQYISQVKKESIVEIMNSEAKTLGMKSTHYENPIGWDSEQNYSTAEDLKLLLDTIRPISLFSDIDRSQSYAFTSENGNNYSIKATNTLLATDPEIHAIKTGFTNEAGGAMITAIHHQNLKFVIIVLGSSNREADTKLLKQQVIQKISPDSQ